MMLKVNLLKIKGFPAKLAIPFRFAVFAVSENGKNARKR
jgi:hypothetical protein